MHILHFNAKFFNHSGQALDCESENISEHPIEKYGFCLEK